MAIDRLSGMEGASAFPALTDDEVRALGEGFAVVRQDRFPVEPIQAALEARRGQFSPAGIGKVPARHPEVRGDHTAWLEDLRTDPALVALRRWFESGVPALREALRMRLDRVEIQAAFYPGDGAVYAAHRDTFANDPARRLSLILYLNAGWDPSWGGLLRVHEPDGPREIEPRAGTLVWFSSAHLRHEVLPVHHERWAVTGWYGAGVDRMR
jgi:SM-20-related protein